MSQGIRAIDTAHDWLFENLGAIKGRITSFVYLSYLTDSPHSMLSTEQFHVFSCKCVTLCRHGQILWVQIRYYNRECDSMACHPSANSKIKMNPTEVKKTNTKIHLLYIELTISFLKGWKCTVNFRNQCLWHKIIMSRSQVIIWRSQVIMSSLCALCWLSSVKKRKHDFYFFLSTRLHLMGFSGYRSNLLLNRVSSLRHLSHFEMVITTYHFEMQWSTSQSDSIVTQVSNIHLCMNMLINNKNRHNFELQAKITTWLEIVISYIYVLQTELKKTLYMLNKEKDHAWPN